MMAVSAPLRRRKDAASKVRAPVRMAKFLVSTAMPANSTVASITSSDTRSWKYCRSSVTSSQVEEAYGSM
ncbi:hypothetical protein D3C76_1362040 [compost metagenome]